MMPAKNIQPDFTPADSDSDIPAGVDAFLRELARWTVEDRQFAVDPNLEDSQSIKALEEFDESTGFDNEALFKNIS